MGILSKLARLLQQNENNKKEKEELTREILANNKDVKDTKEQGSMEDYHSENSNNSVMVDRNNGSKDITEQKAEKDPNENNTPEDNKTPEEDTSKEDNTVVKQTQDKPKSDWELYNEDVDRYNERIDVLIDLWNKLTQKFEKLKKDVEEFKPETEEDKVLKAKLMEGMETIELIINMIDKMGDVISDISHRSFNNKENIIRIKEEIKKMKEKLNRHAEVLNNHTQSIEREKEKVKELLMKYARLDNDIKEMKSDIKYLERSVKDFEYKQWQTEREITELRYRRRY